MITDATLPERITRFINRLIFLEKKSVFAHEGLRLYPSELHLMQVISDGQSVNATSMAERLGVTKGAVSQTISRLEKKGIVTKTKDPMSKNELTVRFTATGHAAMEAFSGLRAENRKQHALYLAGLSEKERETVTKFLEAMERLLSGLG